MTNTQEENLAAVIETPQSRITVVNRAIPFPGPRELLVRNHAIAVNPVDWKIQDYNFFVDKYPTVLGSDVCGIVSAVGPGVTKFQVGDRVAGFAAVIYNSDIDHGACQTYTILHDLAVTQIPSFMSYEEGSILPMAAATAALGLFINCRIPRPITSPNSGGQVSGILIWGGAASVGTLAIQVAKNLGLTIFATASPAHHQYLKSLGASEVFDYKDPQVKTRLVAAARHVDVPITYGFDAVSEGNTFSMVTDVLASSGGHEGLIATVLPWPDELPKPKSMTISQIIALSLGSEQADLSAWLFNEWLKNALEKKTIVPSPKIEVVDGGIKSTQKAFDKLKAGVSGTKLVLQVD